MKTRVGRKTMKMERTTAVRASISFPVALYETLEDILCLGLLQDGDVEFGVFPEG
jgi:hypothetical protein